jgi:hypothetical protein
MTYQDLTPEQSDALEAFALEHDKLGGVGWRLKLGEGWACAAYPGPLQQVRNSHGGQWLTEVYAWRWRATVPSWERPTFDPVTGHPSEPSEGAARWSATFDPPAVGARVRNRLGAATVTGYFVQDGWLGLIVLFDEPPAQYLKQWGGNMPVHVFGAECSEA